MKDAHDFRTLLSVHPAAEPPAALAPVVALARAALAHVDALALETVSPIPTMAFALDPAHDWDEGFATVIERAERSGRELGLWFEREGVDADVQAEALQLGLVADRVAHAALYTDLVVLRRGESLVGGMMGQALEGALFGAGKPVLVLDAAGGTPPVRPGEAMIAWDGGREAARAVQLALPLLRAATTVRATIVEEASAGTLEHEVAALERYLGRHGVRVVVEPVAPAGRFVSRALLEHVGSRGPELLVMGAYGHGRLRERLFSGTTRAALAELDVPLFLAH